MRRIKQPGISGGKRHDGGQHHRRNHCCPQANKDNKRCLHHVGHHYFCTASTNSHSLFGLSGHSRISTRFSSASSTACANNGPTGLAPASPAPLMPNGLSGEGVTTCPVSTFGTSNAVGSK